MEKEKTQLFICYISLVHGYKCCSKVLLFLVGEAVWTLKLHIGLLPIAGIIKPKVAVQLLLPFIKNVAAVHSE